MPTESLDPPQVKEMLQFVANRIIEAEPKLSDADRALGDGDHGLGMQRGMTEAKKKLEAAPEAEPIDKLFAAVGMAMMSTMGGASGVVFGTLFRDGGKALTGHTRFDANALAAFLDAACHGVMTRGKAKPGDKTMVDALHPATAKAREVTDQPLEEALAAVAAAAEAGKEASREMVATIGRAKNLGQAALGHADAGALSVSIILQAMHEYCASQP